MIIRARSDGFRGARPILWAAAFGLLLVPAIAMRLTDEVRWTAFDFVFAAILIAGLGGGVELALRRSHTVLVKTAAIVAVTAVFALIWINAAVGIVGSEANPQGWVVVAAISAILAVSVWAIARISR